MIRRKRSPLNAILTIVTRSVMGLGLLYLYILFNLAHYSVYYASKMPHSSRTNPEAAMFVRNQLFLKTPKDEIYYQFDFLEDGLGVRPMGVFLNEDTIESDGPSNGAFSIRSLTEYWGYYFDNKGRFLFYTPDKWADEPIKDGTQERAKEADELLDKVLSPYLKDYPKPVINLQWLFNWKYQDQFK